LKVTHLNPKDLPDWSALFSQVVSVEANGITTLFISGQVGVGPDQRIAGSSFVDQLERAFQNLSIALRAGGGDLQHVTRLTVYVVNYSSENSVDLRTVIRRHFDAGRLPALSLIGIQALARPEFSVEVEATAVIPTTAAGA
jgi:enamine deaminase RidA (YjgF/YER057c/UK114 family)